MNLAELRSRLRTDLHDEDPDDYRWSDDELDRHIGHALRELSLACPRQSTATLFTSAGSRELSISALDGLVAIEGVEYPTGCYPRSYVRFSRWADTLTLLTDAVPAEEEVRVYYGSLHTLDEQGATVPTALEDLLAIGASGYAALEWASFATNRVNMGGSETWRAYLQWGQDRLSEFMKGLANHGRHSSVRVLSLYRPARPPSRQATDWGPDLRRPR